MPVNTTSLYDGIPDGSIPQFMSYIVDPFIGLARASAVTQRLKLGTGICLVPEHNPSFWPKGLPLWTTSPTADLFSVSDQAG